MGKTSKPLTIVALPPCDEWDLLGKLEVQGHKVIKVSTATYDGDPYEPGVTRSELLDADLILGPNCWRMTTLHAKYLPVAIKEARMLRYKAKEDRADVKKRKDASAEFDGDELQLELQFTDTGDADLPTD